MVKKKKGNKKSEQKKFFIDCFIESWKYLKASRKFVYSIIIIFALFAVLGFVLPIPELLLERILALIQEILAKTEGMNFWGLFYFIFVNNAKVSLMGLIVGILFGVFPVITAIGNGYLLGFVGKYASRELGFFSLWRILPHGIFELPAIFISLGLGLKLGIGFIKKRDGKFKDDVLSSLKVFFLIIIPLLIVAALIEAALITFAG